MQGKCLIECPVGKNKINLLSLKLFLQEYNLDVKRISIRQALVVNALFRC